MKKFRFLAAAVFLSLLAASAGPEKFDLFTGGKGGYNTFRIPALMVTAKGTVLAFCEGRRFSQADHGFVNLVYRRSVDGGRTWEPLRLIQSDGWHTIGNPSPVQDRETGEIFLLNTRDNDRVFVRSSKDDGLSWSEPRDITSSVKPEGWGWYATGPGHAIQLRSGRLLVPCDHRDGAGVYSHVIYSDDHGVTWKLGGSAGKGTDEAMAFERADGSVYLTMRNFTHRRAYAVSHDGGETWTETEFDDALIDPICQASVLRIPGAEGMVLFLNPASLTRHNLTLRLSSDEGKTWPISRVISKRAAAYSDLALLPDGTILCLYENGARRYWQKITFARISLDWLTAETSPGN